ncbi:MAG: extracellular solute-binding protein [Treponema sp.]|nr:extracellular solute-binding protein [Treponema sp.]
MALSEAGLDPKFFSGEITGTITISAYDTMFYRNFLVDAAKAFESLYPGIMVNVETFSAMPVIKTGDQGMMVVEIQNDPQSRADYISRINTNIMSGTGADLYAMDVLPLHKCAESGTLENLDSYIATDPGFHKRDYRENILDAARFKDGTWFLPLDYDFNFFTYDTTLVPVEIGGSFGIDDPVSTEDLLRIGTVLYNGTYKLFNIHDYSRGPISMFNILLNENIQSYLNLETRKANFVDGSFASMLNSVKNYGAQGFIPQGVTGQQDAGQLRQRTAGASADRFYFKQYNATNLLAQFTRKLGMVMRSEGGMAAGIVSDDEIAGIRANANGSVSFTFSQGYGINSQSKNKAAAWAFIKFLLSKEVQLSPNFIAMGLPINNEARFEKAELTISAFAGSTEAMNDQLRKALDEYRAAAETLSDSIDTFVLLDSSLNDMIAQEVVYFFGNSRTADEVARVLQNKADLYLSE